MPDAGTTVQLPKKQQQIITTATELFLRHGIKRITIEEICEKAGVSKMTFYKYFPDKISLAKYIQHTWMNECLAKLEEIDTQAISIQAKLDQIFEYTNHLLAMMENEFFTDYVALELDHLDQELVMHRIMQMILQAQQRGEIRASIRPELLLAIHEKTHELMHDENLLKLYPDYATFTRELFDLFYYGILAQPTVGHQ